MNNLNLTLIRQNLFSSTLENISKEIDLKLDSLTCLTQDFKDSRIAVAVGSRGIDQISESVASCIRFLKKKGAAPFIVPAMGSHGGANKPGQIDILRNFDITEETMGCPINAEMDTQCIGILENGFQIFFSKRALEADYIVPVNRIKSHTKFQGDIQSGLCKMLAVGLGKAYGAEKLHSFAINHGFGVIEQAAEFILQNCQILFGLALVEDGYAKLSEIIPITGADFIKQEKKILKKVKKASAGIPFDNLDLLIVDIMGKNISGIGMDSNVTGRHRDITGNFDIHPHVKRIFVRDLSKESDGNANGIGLADITTKRLVSKINFQKTYSNAITAISPEKASVPINFESDREALEICAKILGLDSLDKARVVRIKSTQHIQYMEVSEALISEVNTSPDLKQIRPLSPVKFDETGNMPDIS